MPKGEKKPTIKPLGYCVLVKPEKIQEKTEGGIYIPDRTRDQEQNAVTRGVVVAIGKLAWWNHGEGQPWAEIGDKVIFAKYGGKIIKDRNGEEFRILNDEDIIAMEPSHG